MKKNLLIILLAILIGIVLSNYIFSEYKNNKTNVKAKNKSVYVYQIGAYKDKNNMEESLKDLESYYFYKKNNIYYVLIGISFYDNLADKFKEAYNINSTIYVKKINVYNKEFINNLLQYDKLIKDNSDKNLIINAEKQILQKYDELIINEQNTY